MNATEGAREYLRLVDEAAAVTADHLRTTPVEHSPALSKLVGIDVFLKLECLQLTGSFKLRGAWACLSALTPEAAARGVATCSAGNHGIALAYAARHLGIPATVFLPGQVDPSKKAAIKDLGAEVICSQAIGFDEVEPEALAAAADRGLSWISAFDDDRVMAGNGGTLGLEVCRQLPECANWILPVGGGGLAAGVVRYLAAVDRPFHLIACQHQECPALVLSLERRAPVTRMPPIDTWAGGIEGGIGGRTFPHLFDRVDHVALVSESDLQGAVAWLLEEHHYLIEPSAAAPVAACLSGQIPRLRGSAVIVLTGRNFALSRLRVVLNRTAPTGSVLPSQEP